MNKIKKIVESLDKSVKNYVVFDCDDTIITGDVEKLTIRYQLEKKEYRITLERLKEKLRKYEEFKEEIDDLTLDDKFLSLIHKIYLKYNADVTNLLLEGYSENEVYELTKKALKYYDKQFSKREYIEKLFNYFKENDIEIYICSASVRYEVLVASDMYGIKRENVFGINIAKDENGILTGEEEGMITRGIGKVNAINSLGYGYPPIIIAGDSDGDYEMLKAFNILHAMIINPRDNTKVKALVDNFVYFEYRI